MAERVGFEPTVTLRLHQISSLAHSTTLTPLHARHCQLGAALELSVRACAPLAACAPQTSFWDPSSMNSNAGTSYRQTGVASTISACVQKVKILQDFGCFERIQLSGTVGTFHFFARNFLEYIEVENFCSEIAFVRPNAQDHIKHGLYLMQSELGGE